MPFLDKATIQGHWFAEDALPPTILVVIAADVVNDHVLNAARVKQIQ
ncbi:hypothetical protein CRENPOLYSF1_270004 [Crenothrix polyspora]|uniref:Uncharacterized protein n=1 Tax=Crenothrix polyspora TaxID=360316 RepID=A0A1R4H7K7_9GAMM|nr:hypothetical protein CRENPOLYSF1_270004 [Crenothrix polyspora]